MAEVDRVRLGVCMPLRAKGKKKTPCKTPRKPFSLKPLIITEQRNSTFNNKAIQTVDEE